MEDAIIFALSMFSIPFTITFICIACEAPVTYVVIGLIVGILNIGHSLNPVLAIFDIFLSVIFWPWTVMEYFLNTNIGNSLVNYISNLLYYMKGVINGSFSVIPLICFIIIYFTIGYLFLIFIEKSIENNEEANYIENDQAIAMVCFWPIWMIVFIFDMIGFIIKYIVSKI